MNQTWENGKNTNSGLDFGLICGSFSSEWTMQKQQGRC